VWDRLYMEK